ncbi:DUF4139 domain-containing protein [Hydrogenimonas cancrithermarum]|uniref:DUF4139 domain-containing protein n=1 Tax=Hydrogenimonas cancrithermarum TaxID=2993563 RepID=A0ABN6WWY8_9BACT|nr:DUF4139 domain-containing protein [Hydrogenimonas cancrithermarum]BDY13765.1 hypothetical protein HCR_20770 [Hydrogenimonas cancrithermarum]
MKVLKPLLIVLAATLVTHAATLEVYRDGAIYTYRPSGKFVGFPPKDLKAECNGRAVTLYHASECPKQSRLCKEKRAIEKFSLASFSALQQMHFIDTLIERAEVKIAAPDKVLEMSKKAAEIYSALQKRKRESDNEVKWRNTRFMQQAPSMEPKQLPLGCKGDVKLTIPSGYIRFGLYYEADLSKSATIGVTRHLELTNRSGIDIDADRAVLFYQPIKRYLRPIHFSPWVIHDKRLPRPVATERKMSLQARAPVVEDAAGKRFESVASSSPRSYRIERLHLPSDGETVDIAIDSWSVAAQRFEVVYPYRDVNVYEAVKFSPKEVIETNRWRIRSGKKVLADYAYGEFFERKYRLYTGVDEDLVVRREKMILKERETGIFGKTVRKKDGYTIRIFNQSKRPKTLQVVERIPVASREDVEVKLLHVKSDRGSMDHRLEKKGKLLIDVTVPAHEEARIDVLFEVSYDKDKPVVF